MATKTFKVALSLDNPRIIQSGIDVRSFDKQSIKIAIELTKNSQTYQIPTGSQIKISLLKISRQEQKIILDVPFTSAEAIEWLVPDYLDGYQGEVRVGVYLIVGTENIDVGYFNIASKVSDIDKAAEEFTDSVMQGWDQIEADLAEIRAAITQVNTLASDATSKYNAFNTSVTQAGQTIDDILALQPQFQSVLDETTGKDVISAPEIILARNGEADLKTRLDKDHQEVTAQLAQKANQSFVDSQLAQKAEQIDLATERGRIDNLISLPAGSTTNDARLEDIAIGADGIIYESPGEAVRNQLLKKANKKEVDDARISMDIFHSSLSTRLKYDYDYFRKHFLNMHTIPEVAIVPGDMTDTSKNYVYQGTSSGDFWFGQWYFWDGSAWRRGGVYEPVVSTEVIIARNSNAKGKKFNNLDARLEETEADVQTLQADIQALQAMGSGGISSVKYPSPGTLSATYYPTNSNAACHIKGDTLIGYRFNKVVKSLDGGITWGDFSPTLSTMPVNGQYLHWMNDGHILVFGIDTSTNDGVILRSSDANFDTNTEWVEIKRILGKSFASSNPYGFHIEENVVLTSTYPSYYPVLLSTDYGQTFTEIFSKSVRHIHHSYIDPYDKTIWVATGDGTVDRNIYYSKDWGTTWDSVWEEGTAPTQITSIISRPDSVLFGSDVAEEYQVWRYDKKTGDMVKEFSGGETETSTVCSLGVTPYNQETTSGLITWLPFQAEDNTKRWRLIATPDSINYYVIHEPAVLTTDKNLIAVVGVFDNKLIVKVAGNIAHYPLPNWLE